VVRVIGGLCDLIRNWLEFIRVWREVLNVWGKYDIVGSSCPHRSSLLVSTGRQTSTGVECRQCGANERRDHFRNRSVFSVRLMSNWSFTEF
jgi:hypothetical protein